MPGEQSFVRIGDCEKIVSHISGENNRICLRLYDVSGTEETVTVTMPAAIRRMSYVNLKGDVLADGAFAGNKANIVCPPHKIVTVELELKKA